MNLLKVLRELAEARKALARLKAAQAEGRKMVEATPEGRMYAVVRAHLKEAQLEESGIDQRVRALALEVYGLGDLADPMPDNIKIKHTKFVVNVGNPEDWARENMPGIFEFSEKKWTAAVKAGLVPDDVAWIKESPRVFIDKDLSGLLEEENDDTED